MERTNLNEVLLDYINNSGAWLTVREIASLSSVPASKCRVLLPELANEGKIGMKMQMTKDAADEVAFFAKLSLARQEELTRNNAEDVRFAKSRFVGGQPPQDRPYNPTFEDKQGLVMMLRR